MINNDDRSTKSAILNNLQLGYSPLSAFDFMQMAKDKSWRDSVFDSHIYIIAQRKEITFNEFVFDDPEVIEFKIKQEGSDEYFLCRLPVFQDVFKIDRRKAVSVKFQNRRHKTRKTNLPPYNNTQSIIIESVDVESGEVSHVVWYSVEKILQNYWKGHISIDIDDGWEKLLNYKVHYVGKATEQNICERLSKHSTFQEILTFEDALSYGNIPSNEITILLFRIYDNNTFVKWGENATGEEMSDYLTNYIIPSDKDVSLDAEKVLIKKLQPSYNKVRFKSYPTSKDIVNRDFHDVFMYSFIDPIKLQYEDNEIVGGVDIRNRSYIHVDSK